MNRKQQIILILLLMVMGTTLSGCTGIAWLASVFVPPKTTPAVYELSPDKKVLVLVDDLGKPVRYEQIKRLLTEKVNRLLLDNKAVKKVVSYQDVFRLMARRNDYHSMGIANIARELGAEQTLYIRLDEFSLKDDPNISLWHGKLGVSVKVVDNEGNVKWPVNLPAGHKPDIADSATVDDPSPTYGATLAAELADEMAEKVAKLFYKHTEARGHLGESD
ncbi:MAG: hypothetical protein GY794_08735 [bacterium]|nr:hypothetical protein [bacterium]